MFEISDVCVATTSIYPDVRVVDTGARSRGQGGVATAAPIRLATVVPTRVPQAMVEIREASSRRLVAAIEVLSPTNKRSAGREEYLTKRRRILLSTAHLIEIDLLRQGQRVPMQQPLPDAPYFVVLSRAEERPITEVWPIQLDEHLPLVPVPLLPNDADVALDLQQALANVYYLLGYDLAIDYSGPAELPLRPDQATWAEKRLRRDANRAR